MQMLRIFRFILAAVMLPISCTVISEPVRTEAEAPVPFNTLIAQADEFRGRTVILGGYILETRNLDYETIIKVLQAPMRIGEEPDLKDRSEGRFLIYHRGFLDPEVYSKDRAITVAGEVIGSGTEELSDSPILYLKLKYREIYLWPDYPTHRSPYPSWSYPYYRYPYQYWW